MNFTIINKKMYLKIKNILKNNLPYVLYKQLFDIYEKEKEELFINTFFSYLCYLSETEFNSLKSEIEKVLKEKIEFEYTPIPLFNNLRDKKRNKKSCSVLKPKVEYETLEKEEIINLIKEQERKEKIKNKDKEFNV